MQGVVLWGFFGLLGLFCFHVCLFYFGLLFVFGVFFGLFVLVRGFFLFVFLSFCEILTCLKTVFAIYKVFEFLFTSVPRSAINCLQDLNFMV